MLNIKCIVFDVGNVLWNYEPFHRELFGQWAKLVEMTDSQLYQEFNRVYQEFEKGEKDYLSWLAELGENINCQQVEENLKDLIDRHFQEYLNSELLDLIPELKEQHIIVGCLSNTENFMERFHRKLGKKIDFDFQILSYEVGARKPEKKIYQEIFEYVDFKPSEILFIDDKQENVAGAKELGINSLHYKSYEQLKRTLHDCFIFKT